jgi:hypothetical protein
MFKKSVVIRANKLKKINFKFNYKTTIFLTLLLCGVMFGVTLSNKGNIAWHTFFNTFVHNHLTVKVSSSFFRNFCSIFFSFMLICLFDYICGLCGVGAPFLYLTPLFFGIYCGVVTSQFYYIYKLSGLLYCAIINTPCYAITAATLIKCCTLSFDVSKEIFIYLLTGRSDTKEKILHKYTVQYLILCIPIALSALLNVVSFKLFGNLFNFI